MKIYFLISAFIFSGCTTSSVKYVSSFEGQPSFYKNGLAFTEKEDGNTTYAYSISESTNNTILALINVKNNSKKAVEVDSSQYSLVLLGKNHKYKSENPEKLIYSFHFSEFV